MPAGIGQAHGLVIGGIGDIVAPAIRAADWLNRDAAARRFDAVRAVHHPQERQGADGGGAIAFFAYAW